MLYVVLLLICVVILIGFGGYKGYDSHKFGDKDSILRFINPLSCYIYDTFLKDNRWLFKSDRVRLFTLGYKDEKTYTVKKLSTALFILMCALMMGAFLQIAYERDEKFGNTLIRAAPGGKDKKIGLIAKGDGIDTTLELEVPARIYSAEEIMGVFDEIYEDIVSRIPDIVDRDLDFKAMCDNDIIDIHIKSESPYIDDYGVIDEELLTDSCEALIKLYMEYEDYRGEYDIYLNLEPPKLSESKKKEKELKKEIENLIAENPSADKIELPSDYTYKVNTKNYAPFMVFAFLLLGVIYFFAPDSKLASSMAKRSEQMLLDYSELLSKLTLLLGCGMSLRSSFERIVGDYKKTGKKRYVYDELEITVNRMDSGYSQSAALEDFAFRCQLTEYTRLTNLLIQNLKKGNEGLLAKLEEEAADAFIQRKNTARIRGEKASTKLLVPMMIMLVLVLAIVIVPVFMSF